MCLTNRLTARLVHWHGRLCSPTAVRVAWVVTVAGVAGLWAAVWIT